MCTYRVGSLNRISFASIQFSDPNVTTHSDGDDATEADSNDRLVDVFFMDATVRALNAIQGSTKPEKLS